MTPDRAREDWLRFVAYLDEWAEAAAPSVEDRIRVTLSDGRVVEVVLTPDDLDMLFVAFGGLPDIAGFATERLRSMPADCGYLVYDTYDLVPSATAVLPEDPDEVRMRELLRQHPEGFGTWFAIGRDGERYPFPEPPPR